MNYKEVLSLPVFKEVFPPINALDPFSEPYHKYSWSIRYAGQNDKSAFFAVREAKLINSIQMGIVDTKDHCLSKWFFVSKFYEPFTAFRYAMEQVGWTFPPKMPSRIIPEIKKAEKESGINLKMDWNINTYLPNKRGDIIFYNDSFCIFAVNHKSTKKYFLSNMCYSYEIFPDI